MKRLVLALSLICLSTGAFAGESASLSSKAENKAEKECKWANSGSTNRHGKKGRLSKTDTTRSAVQGAAAGK